MQRNLLLIFLFSLLFYACGPSGYKKENGKWAYVYYNEGVGKGVDYLDVDENTFTVLDNGEYAKDKNSVFYHASKIETADPASFQPIENTCYAKDQYQVYLDYEIMIEADPATFKPLAFPYSKDDQTIFCGTVPMDVENVNEFKVTESSDLRISTFSYDFIKSEPEYDFIDTAIYKGVIYGGGRGETKTEKFEGYKKVK